MIAKEIADKIHNSVKDKFSDEQKIQISAVYSAYLKARIEENKAELEVIRFETEDMMNNISLMEASPLEYFNNNGPYNVVKSVDYEKAMENLKTARKVTDAAMIAFTSGLGENSPKIKVSEQESAELANLLDMLQESLTTKLPNAKKALN
jgi:methionyl-tRNA synthetase